MYRKRRHEPGFHQNVEQIFTKLSESLEVNTHHPKEKDS